MKILRCCSLALAGLAFASTSASPQVIKGSRVPLDVKLGLWEITSVTHMSGMPPIDSSRMSPEQQKRLQAAMEASKQRAATPHTTHSCLTKEKLEKELFQESKASCKQTVRESTSTVYAVEVVCGGENPYSGEWRFQALTPETVKGSGSFRVGDNKMTSTSSMSGKWLGPSCGNVK